MIRRHLMLCSRGTVVAKICVMFSSTGVAVHLFLGVSSSQRHSFTWVTLPISTFSLPPPSKTHPSFPRTPPPLLGRLPLRRFTFPSPDVLPPLQVLYFLPTLPSSQAHYPFPGALPSLQTLYPLSRRSTPPPDALPPLQMHSCP